MPSFQLTVAVRESMFDFAHYNRMMILVPSRCCKGVKSQVTKQKIHIQKTDHPVDPRSLHYYTLCVFACWCIS
jgi:hypothetical protein